MLVLGFWVVGGTLQTVLGQLVGRSGLVDESAAGLIALILAWGLLFVLSLAYRERLDDWLRD